MPSVPSSGINWPTFTVAAIGAVTGVFSVAWNFMQYISSGSKIHVTIHYIYYVSDGPVFEVDAYNKRRGSVEIRRWGVRTYESKPTKFRKYTRRYTTVYLPFKKDSDEVPKTIQGEHGASWRVQAKELVTFEDNRRNWVKIRAVVQLGNNKEKKSKPLKLQPGSLHQTPKIIE